MSADKRQLMRLDGRFRRCSREMSVSLEAARALVQSRGCVVALSTWLGGCFRSTEKIVPSAGQADCSLGQTVISSEYNPLSVRLCDPVYFHVIYLH